jgi:hypothetical protein
MTTQQIEDMATTIRTTEGASTFVAGDPSNVENAAQEWVDAGFTPDEAQAWWKAGAFDAQRAAQMRQMGLTLEQASETYRESESWAYAYSNGDCSDLEIADFFNLH